MRFIKFLKSLVHQTFGPDYCPICKHRSFFRPFGNPKRLKALCPFCGALERHRFLFGIYKKYFLNSDKPLSIMHTAPEKCFSDIIQEYSNIDYFPIDISPELYPYTHVYKADVTCLPFEDESFDVILSNHVLEHIENEKKCLQEFNRVLKSNGKIFLTVPVAWENESTYEDSSIKTPEGRKKAFRQEDHVRLYGQDVVKRLEEYFNVTQIGEGGLLAPGQLWSHWNYCFLLTKK